MQVSSMDNIHLAGMVNPNAYTDTVKSVDHNMKKLNRFLNQGHMHADMERYIPGQKSFFQEGMMFYRKTMKKPAD